MCTHISKHACYINWPRSRPEMAVTVDWRRERATEPRCMLPHPSSSWQMRSRFYTTSIFLESKRRWMARRLAVGYWIPGWTLQNCDVHIDVCLAECTWKSRSNCYDTLSVQSALRADCGYIVPVRERWSVCVCCLFCTPRSCSRRARVRYKSTALKFYYNG